MEPPNPPKLDYASRLAVRMRQVAYVPRSLGEAVWRLLGFWLFVLLTVGVLLAVVFIATGL